MRRRNGCWAKLSAVSGLPPAALSARLRFKGAGVGAGVCGEARGGCWPGERRKRSLADNPVLVTCVDVCVDCLAGGGAGGGGNQRRLMRGPLSGELGWRACSSHSARAAWTATTVMAALRWASGCRKRPEVFAIGNASMRGPML